MDLKVLAKQFAKLLKAVNISVVLFVLLDDFF